jgi:acyl carrier protein
LPAFTLDDLQKIAREIIGDRDIVLAPQMSADDVPGWDSLNHTLITLEIAGRFGANVEAPELGGIPTFGEVVTFINHRIS